MARRGIGVVDAELHLLEPYEGWSDRLPEPWRSRTTITGPARGHLDTGNVGIQLDGKGWPLPDIGGTDGKGRLVYRQGNRKYAECPDLARLRAEATPKAWLEGMDMDGIDVAVLAPTVQLRLLAIDGVAPEHTAALCRAYNDYAAEFASHEPSRLKPWAWVPRQAPDLAAAEARRCVEELGAVGVAMTTAGVDGTVLTDDAFEPLWSEIERLGVPFGLHLSGQCHVADDVGHRYEGHPRTEVVRMSVRLPFYAQTAMAELIVGGVLERHPGLKVVLEEANVAWLPWLLWRMDEKWETYGPDQDYELSLSPTEYFLRQCYAVADADESVASLAIAHLGDRNILWSSDFPHHDTSWPGSVDTFLDLPGISEASKRRILWDNAVEAFGLP
jgi:predicted TIM-barrel fold metal-dependent hydrolase